MNYLTKIALCLAENSGYSWFTPKIICYNFSYFVILKLV